MACGILVSKPGIEPRPPAQSPNHWTARKFPYLPFFKKLGCFLLSLLNKQTNLYLFIYFIFGCAESSLLHTAFR